MKLATITNHKGDAVAIVATHFSAELGRFVTIPDSVSYNGERPDDFRRDMELLDEWLCSVERTRPEIDRAVRFLSAEYSIGAEIWDYVAEFCREPVRAAREEATS